MIRAIDHRAKHNASSTKKASSRPVVVSETDNIAIAVWRLCNRILTTGGQRVYLIHLADRRRTGY